MMFCKECKRVITNNDIFITDGDTYNHYFCITDPNALRKFIEGHIHIGSMNWKKTLMKFKEHE